MPPTDWLSRLRSRSRRADGARPRPAPVLRGARDWVLEDRCLPAGGPMIEFPLPYSTVGTIGEVLYDGVTGSYVKTVTITNNSPDQTIYAFLEGQNSRLAIPPYIATGAFNPFDPANQEYRAYIGYTDGTKTYAGLPPNSSITIPVPLVFWDSGRIYFSTDGADQFQDAPGAAAPGAPFYYHNTNTQAGFYASINAGQLDRLVFTPVHNSFDPANGYMPSTKDWKSPVELGLLKTGMSVNVPGGQYTITVDPAHPEYVTLSAPAPTPLAAQQFVFTSAAGESISPTARHTSTGYTLTTPQGTSTNGAVMWYHALKANIPNNDAPFQLSELTFRGDFYNPAINTTTGFQYLLGDDPGNGINANDFDLADYDLSFVDSINMPVALEAKDAVVPNPRAIAPGGATEAGSTVTITTVVPHGLSAGQRVSIFGFTGPDVGYNGSFVVLPTGLTPTTFQYANTVTGLPTSTTGGVVSSSNTRAPFGWVGSSQDLGAFQTALENFAKTNPAGQNVNGLGQYFGGRGYPSYVVIDPNSLKLPAGQNLFLASPMVPDGKADIFYIKTFNDGSKIQEQVYALTSAGDGPAQLSINSQSDPDYPSQGQNLRLNTLTEANRFILNDLVAPNLKDGFTYTITYNDNGVDKPVGTTTGMYKDGSGNNIGVTFNGTLPTDPDSRVYTLRLVITDYATQAISRLWYTWANYYATKVQSTVPQMPLPGTIAVGSNVLKLGTATTGLVPGMAVTGAALPGGCVILKVAPDNQTITLSTAATGANGTFTFAKPSVNAIAGYDPMGFTPLLPGFSFTVANQDDALAFAQTVYAVMSAWSVTVPVGSQNGWNTLLTNIIGGNLGKNFLPNANEDAVNILTVLSKSALRGVPDYTSALYSDPAQWYPDPAVKTGGQQFNAYNLNPFVWFIHEKLGLSGYAFALDDDVGNVGAGGATHVDITVGGLTGLVNKDPYTPVSPFGVVTTQVTAPFPPIRSSVLGNLTTPVVVNQISAFDYPHNLLGAMVNGQGVTMGTTVQFTQIAPDPKQTRVILSRPLTAAGTATTTYAFFGPLVFTGTLIGQAPARIVLDSKDAYDTLLKLGPITNIQVNGPGIPPTGTPVTVSRVTRDKQTGVVTVYLNGTVQPGSVSQPGSSYGYTFGDPAVGAVRDDGFEWAVVQGLAGNFNHGKQVSQNTVDWTFADSKTNTAWFAGIAANGGTYTSGNPAAPQGLQVAFITGDSSITQTVTLGAGRYVIRFSAAQRANKPQTAQTLNVLVDGKVVGTITPTGTTYALYSTPAFNLAAGAHTITFQGTQKSDSTVLFDMIVCDNVSKK